ncbi:MAG: peptidylprolyl isomerase, partial [Pseudomonadota bacterium]|nr:peptidylprolyl isomerase [Pseudomonadota bacterium]
GPGDVAPEFEKAVAELQENEVSQPVKTRYGYHLIQFLGRREHDAAEDLARNRARQAIHTRKAEEFYQAWLTELRDRSYVEFVDTP